MSETEKNSAVTENSVLEKEGTAETPGYPVRQNDFERPVSNDPITELMEKAQENLMRIGFVNVKDIIESFSDRDRSGRHTTCLEIREEYWDPIEKKVCRSVSRATTTAPEIHILKSGDYTTVALQFDTYHSDMNLIWNILEKFGDESKNITVLSDEIPVLVFTGVPMALGGQYGMVATDPRFWCIQPSIPTSQRCDQIRILFPPEAVVFLKDATINTEEIRNHVKSELAAEQLQMEDRARKDLEAEELKKERDNRISDYLESERRNRHTFRATKKDDAYRKTGDDGNGKEN